MKLLKITFLTLIVISFGISISRGEETPKASIESASTEQFELLLAKVKSLHSKGEATYSSGDFDSDWNPFKPFLIVVRHNQVEFFLNSDLTSPTLLKFIRMTGTWSQTSSRWTVTLKKAGEANSSELWSRADQMSSGEVEQDRKYREYHNAMKTAEQAGAGQPATRSEFKSEGSDKPQPEAEGRSR